MQLRWFSAVRNNGVAERPKELDQGGGLLANRDTATIEIMTDLMSWRSPHLDAAFLAVRMRHRLCARRRAERMAIENLRVVYCLLELLLERRGTDEVRVVMQRIGGGELTPEAAIRLLEALDERDSLDTQAH